MKIIFNKKAVSEAVAPLMCAVSGKSTLPSTEGILIEAQKPDTCTLTTYDLEKGMRITIEAKVIEEGTYIVNAHKFNQTLKVMDGEEILLSIDDKLVASIESGKSVHKMNALQGADFPMVPRLVSDQSFTISQGVLKKMIGKVAYAMGVNDSRPVLNGAYFEVKQNSLLVVSCDSFKVAKCRKEVEVTNSGAEGTKLDFSFIIPVKTVNELSRMLDDDEDESIQVFMTRKNIIFMFGDLIFFSRLVDGRYIDYERVLLKSHKITMEISRSALLSALERAALITEERIAQTVRSSVRFDLAEGVLKVLASSTAGSTYDEINVNHEGESILIAFNNRWLIDSIKACGTEKLKISLTSPLTGINIEPMKCEEGIEEEYMLLPVRMNN